MKALSLLQPWATLVMLGYDFKGNETRSWQTTHRGQLGIHASLGKTKEAREAANNPLIKAALDEHGLTFDTLPRGAMLGTVDVVNMHKITTEFAQQLTPMERAAGLYTPGRWAWQLENRQQFGAPVPCKGHLSVWQVPKKVEYEFIYN